MLALNPLGYTRQAMVGTTGCNSDRRSESLKTNPSESRTATRLREHEIPSKRALASCVEYVPDSCTHRPSIHPSWVWMRLDLS